MTDNEIGMLFVGVALGAQGMTLLHVFWNARDARRDARHARAANKRAAGDQYLNSLRLYQLQQRSPAAGHSLGLPGKPKTSVSPDLANGMYRGRA